MQTRMNVKYQEQLLTIRAVEIRLQKIVLHSPGKRLSRVSLSCSMEFVPKYERIVYLI